MFSRFRVNPCPQSSKQILLGSILADFSAVGAVV